MEAQRSDQKNIRAEQPTVRTLKRKAWTQDVLEAIPIRVKPRKSPLLNLPMEIKLKIYDNVFVSWSLAVFHCPGIQHIRPMQEHYKSRDSTILLRYCDAKLISGPPGCSLLLTCRETYHSNRDRYETGFTGKLILGHVTGLLRGTLGLYLTQESRLKKWYRKVRTLSVSFNLRIEIFKFKMTDLFPHLQSVSILISSTGETLLGRPLARVADAVLEGRSDMRITELACAAVYAFFGKYPIRGRFGGQQLFSENPLYAGGGSVDVKLSHWELDRAGDTVLGYHFGWEGNVFRIAGRAINRPELFKYWTNDMLVGDVATTDIDDWFSGDLRERFAWIIPSGTNFLYSTL